MIVYHTSQQRITDHDLFLPFAEQVLPIADDPVIYALNIPGRKVISAKRLHDQKIIEDIADEFSFTTETAAALLNNTRSPHDQGFNSLGCYWIRSRQAKCVAKMGFDACRLDDIGGQVYIVPMAGKLGELRQVEA